MLPVSMPRSTFGELKVIVTVGAGAKSNAAPSQKAIRSGSGGSERRWRRNARTLLRAAWRMRQAVTPCPAGAAMLARVMKSAFLLDLALARLQDRRGPVGKSKRLAEAKFAPGEPERAV